MSKKISIVILTLAAAVLLFGQTLTQGPFRVTEVAAPATPASGTVAVYAKTDGLLYSKDDAGVETLVSGAGGTITVPHVVMAPTASGVQGSSSSLGPGWQVPTGAALSGTPPDANLRFDGSTDETAYWFGTLPSDADLSSGIDIVLYGQHLSDGTNNETRWCVALQTIGNDVAMTSPQGFTAFGTDNCQTSTTTTANSRTMSATFAMVSGTHFGAVTVGQRLAVRVFRDQDHVEDTVGAFDAGLNVMEFKWYSVH